MNYRSQACEIVTGTGRNHIYALYIKCCFSVKNYEHSDGANSEFMSDEFYEDRKQA
jgi:hypothetical protein